jgi:hypothetical protein
MPTLRIKSERRLMTGVDVLTEAVAFREIRDEAPRPLVARHRNRAMATAVGSSRRLARKWLKTEEVCSIPIPCGY